MASELMAKIMVVMDNVSTVCDPEFSISKLSKMVHSNYVPRLINTALNEQ
jgi:hypothetical protein